jgi:hypothetical protein
MASSKYHNIYSKICFTTNINIDTFLYIKLSSCGIWHRKMEQRTGGSSRGHLPGAVVLNQLEADVSVPSGSVSIWVLLLLPPCYRACSSKLKRMQLSSATETRWNST